MLQLTRRKRRSSRRKLSVQKPRGVLHPRVEKVGPQHFGVVCFDCHKAASKWMLADFYGKVLVEPTKVKHTRPELELAIARVRQVAQDRHLEDLVVAIERTGTYHLPVKRCFDLAEFDTRIVHPFATKHYRLPADAGNKTGDADLDTIFRATIAGYGLRPDPSWSSCSASMPPRARQSDRSGKFSPSCWRGWASAMYNP